MGLVVLDIIDDCLQSERKKIKKNSKIHKQNDELNIKVVTFDFHEMINLNIEHFKIIAKV